MRWIVVAGIVSMTLLIGCAPGEGQRPREAPGTPEPNQSRTLVLAHRYEPSNLASKVLQSNGTRNTTRLFNAALSLVDDKGAVRPYLAESLPQLNTESWRVMPDGRMETTYTLRGNLTWQDGAPLTADDFVFAFHVYTDPGLAVFISTPQDSMENAVARDARTLVVEWGAPNPLGGTLGFEDLDPLPQHLLGPLYADFTTGRIGSDAFMADPYWTAGYVGAGPYRLERWEPGVQLEGTGFAGHALGGPQIDRLVVRIFLDENQTLATVFAGDQIDYACCNTLRFVQYVTLKQEWETAGKGTAAAIPGTAVFLYLQQRPEYVGDEALLDLRVRRALAHAIDRGAINDGAFDGLGAPTDSPIPPSLPYFAEADRLMTKYPLDPNRSAQLMAEAGYAKDSSGNFVAASGRPVNVDFAVQAASEIQRMQTVLSDSWHKAGFNVRQDVIAPQVFTQLETRHTLPGLSYGFFGGEPSFLSSEVGTAANRWRGRNRSGWTSPDYDRLYAAWQSELDPAARGKDVAQMIALVSEDLPGYSLYFSQGIEVWVSSLHGPTGVEAPQFGDTSRATTPYWDIQTWSFAKG
ncbi:MAG TPA: ABC transporter substrate-binding protein [Chloroflexota bacterium]|nr:ABC transporter substrate-binding protein [Chloroflexota bacterium]